MGRRAVRSSRSACALLLAIAMLLLVPASAGAAEKAQLLATQEAGFARLILAFPDRMDIPPYRVRFENNVLAIEFETALGILLPDMAEALPEYATIARVDPDGRGIRFGLRSAFNLNRMEAGEKLFIDLLPIDWQGLPPSLPEAVIADLSARAKRSAELAEEQRKAELVKTLQPTATVRVGRNPTFVRLQFDWNVDAEGAFALEETTGVVSFDWPVAIDLYGLKADLPKEVKDASNAVAASGSRVTLQLADGIVPRFYQLSPRQFVVDIDVSPEDGLAAALAAEAAVREAREAVEQAEVAEAERRAARLALEADASAAARAAGVPAGTVMPEVSFVGNTVRVGFPFDEETPAAVFRRGDTLWMVFDSGQNIVAPPSSEALSSVANSFEVVSAGETKVVRLDLAVDRLATLGSEGRAWVLSLGDVLLNATEPMEFKRDRNAEGRYEMTADLGRAGSVHMLRDPNVGDTLRVVTVLPPARGVVRDMRYVDFDALRSAHGLVIRARTDDLEVAIKDNQAHITNKTGLTLSSAEAARVLDSGNAAEFRDSYLDLEIWREDDPSKLVARIEETMARAATSEGRLRDNARLELATLQVANQLSYEAIGVLGVLERELSSEDLRKKVRLTRAIADTLAGRPREALAVLTTGGFSEETDALLWRTIARAEADDFKGARADAIATKGIVAAYPNWVAKRFLFAGIRAAVETNDQKLALDLATLVDFAKLEPEEVGLLQLLQGRIAELEGKDKDAMESYGLVIAADFRPSRAEAVYRTLLLLKESGKIDLAKATETLSAEALMWRGTTLEADMRKLLAELYFQNHDYRLGFETVRQAASSFPENSSINGLLAEAQAQFEELYLNGAADELADVDALSLYYDFRQLTPPGSRGDEMIRNLARRLVKVDLLAQAGDLLEYQIDSRLSGIAQAQVAADLALIRLANRDAEGALRVLNRTRLSDLPPILDRQRRVLEARALIDAGRQDLALDLVSTLRGRDIDLLRVDGYWKSKNYTLASELLEVLYSPEPAARQMTQFERMSVVKAGVGFVLANDEIGLSRLRSKFSEQMANSAEWPLFEYVTREIAPTSIEFRKVASEIASIDSLDAFIASYRELYAADTSMAPAKVAAANAA